MANGEKGRGRLERIMTNVTEIDNVSGSNG